MRMLLALSMAVSLSPTPRPSAATVTIRTFQFAPDTLRVRAGTRVVWTNDDEIEHTITSTAADTRDGHFHGVVAKRGATYSAEFEKPGTYRYFCDRHRFMNGTVIITR
jgi:plastocyanin